MKAASAALIAHLDGEVTTLATCWKVTRTDGVILTFTDHDVDVIIDIADGGGSLTYEASTGYNRTAIATENLFGVDSLDVEGLLESTKITKDDMRGGRYDFAEIKVFMVNYEDISQGILKLRRGYMGEVSLRDDTFVGELRGLIQLYTQEIGNVIIPRCRADLFDSTTLNHKCYVQDLPTIWTATTAETATKIGDANVGSYIRPSTFNDRFFKCTTAGTTGSSEPSWNLTLGGTTSDGSVVWETIRANTIEATVLVVTDKRNFTVVANTDAPDAFLTDGRVEFQSPSNNAPIKMEIKQWTLSTKSIELDLPMPFEIEGEAESFLLLENGTDSLLLEDGSGNLLLQEGDVILIKSGCDKSMGVCFATYLNNFNHRGEAHVPGNDLLFKTPDAKA